MPRKILVTSALPYANGPIHIGHLVEYIQTDIFVRFQKMRGQECYYVCADDTHGTAIMLKAQEEGISPEELIQQMWEAHRRDFADFQIDFDCYYTTHSPENRELVEQIYRRLKEGGYIYKREIEQFYDPVKGLFLPDRFIRGTCPRCGAPDQYGDSCEVCGATYEPTELKDPRSALSGVRPVLEKTEHLFFRLSAFQEFLKGWVHQEGHLQPEVANKAEEWLRSGLKDWDISRDAPYFGFEIPDAPGKYFYVWMDAPVGYMASFKKLCAERGLDFEAFWSRESQAELYHFIGKDIVYFHVLFWPAVLEGSGFRTPSAVYVHGFLTVGGEKMSKSRGTFITARTYLDHLDPQYLRYYFAAKLGPGIEDIDLNFEDFERRINADLVGKVVNIASRVSSFLRKRFRNRLASRLDTPELFDRFLEAREELAALYEARDYNKAMRRIMALADEANRYIDQKRPWQMAGEQELQEVCTQALNLYRLIVTYLKPVLPKLAQESEAFLRIPPQPWPSSGTRPLLDHEIEPFRPLIQRVDRKRIEAMVEASREPAGESEKAPSEELIDMETFSKIDLRVARVAKAEEVAGAEKLLRLILDLGDRTMQVFAGIKKHYRPEELEGRLVVVVANLKPRKMRFGVSEGMVLAAGDGEQLFLISPDEGARPGMRVK